MMTIAVSIDCLSSVESLTGSATCCSNRKMAADAHTINNTVIVMNFFTEAKAFAKQTSRYYTISPSIFV